MRGQIGVALCAISTILGTVIGWHTGEQIGISQLPPNAWAGDGMGILDQSLNGSGRGALIGFGIGAIGGLLWHVIAQKFLVQGAVSAADISDGEQIWPPPPTQPRA